MLVSYENKFLFIHVPKTGGSSVRTALLPFAVNPLKAFENRCLNAIGIHVNHYGPYRRKWFRGHESAQTVFKNIPKFELDQLFKFGFVRNPWDLLVSLYHFLPTRPTYRHRKLVASMSFPQFVDAWTSRIGQKEMLCDKQGTLLVDYVGRFESLQEDFDFITHKLGLRADLGHVNKSRHRDYREYYDDNLIELVAQRLADDIQIFGYTFDGTCAIPSQKAA